MSRSTANLGLGVRDQYPPLDTQPLSSLSKKNVSYFYNTNASRYHYGEEHPMKPARLALAHSLIVNYGLHKHMTNYAPPKAQPQDLLKFHSEDYVEFLQRVSPNNIHQFSQFCQRFNMGVDDCPIFDGLFEFCLTYTNSSLHAAHSLLSKNSDIAINWSGGLHHAKKFEASGFCYINDIVLAIIELLRFYPRVMYIDIDVHHGDGVQEAFYHTDRVMTCSFHRYDGQYFPGTGSLDEVGVKEGKNYCINVPLREWMDDEAYAYIFKSVMQNAIDRFQPSVIILQCGSDSLGQDRLGQFNLTVRGHAENVKFIRSFNIPMLVMGGGGYIIKNVSRCWTYETAVCTATDLPSKLPVTEYHSYFGPDFSLHPPLYDPSHSNLNSKQYLDSIRQTIAENMRYLNGAPSVMMQEIPPSLMNNLERDDWEVDYYEDTNPDRVPNKKRFKEDNPVGDKEFYDDVDVKME